MLKNKVVNYKLLKIFLLLLIFILPWTFSNNQDEVNAKYIDGSTVGYYQINTCDISFAEVLLKNINNRNINYVFDNYSNIKCFGLYDLPWFQMSFSKCQECTKSETVTNKY